MQKKRYLQPGMLCFMLAASLSVYTNAVFGIFTAFGTAFKGNYFLDASIKLGYTFL
jgi:hypothetical protein